ncbi:hypothetical protein RchiOBHm_Chr7g0234921 [Rosa chinensis]|uniref:Uncharacterized protein n=1 Tax=Rosa chinensis TaxID=74649 RepID=A0A2P6PGJ0_ROSCH|nr:hypothetical protein RchiOBHm_Chr7g0234921 [Rosa chinensis]
MHESESQLKMALMEENLKMVEQRAVQRMGQWMKEAGFSGMDTSSQAFVEQITQGTSTRPQSNLPIIPTPSMQYGYRPEVPTTLTN